MDAKIDERHLRFWRRRGANRRERADQAAAEARADLGRITDLLVRKFGAKRIILYGSLARGHFAPGSDIDLAVEGVSKRDYFAALGAVNGITERWVDLKPIEQLGPRFRHRVLMEGMEIYAAIDRERNP